MGADGRSRGAAIVALAEADSQVAEAKVQVAEGRAPQIVVDAAMMARDERFENLPHCVVSVGRMSYRWTDKAGREQQPGDFGKQVLKRLHQV
jgi:hypothetical protein